MASAGARAYNGVLGAEPLVGGQGGEATLKLKTVYSFWMRNGSSKFASFCPNLNLK